MSAEEALEVARSAQPAALPEAPLVAVPGVEIGQQVSIAATDYGVDPVLGELLYASSEQVILRREDPRSGQVHVHFPRFGFKVEAC